MSRWTNPRTYASDQGDSQTTFRPQLTSLVDILTFLLVFLIKSFSSDGDIITPSPDLHLPVSSAESQIRRVTSLSVSQTAVLTEDGRMIVRNKDFAAAESLAIPSLLSYMKSVGASLPVTGKPAEVLIQADRDLPFNILKRVMFTCSRAGFMDFSVLAIEEGR